jgi:hypothetical protein
VTETELATTPKSPGELRTGSPSFRLDDEEAEETFIDEFERKRPKGRSSRSNLVRRACFKERHSMKKNNSASPIAISAQGSRRRAARKENPANAPEGSDDGRGIRLIP